MGAGEKHVVAGLITGRWARGLGLGLVWLGLLAGGCATPDAEQVRMTRYSPEARAVRPPGFLGDDVARPAPPAAPAVVVSEVVAPPELAVVPAVPEAAVPTPATEPVTPVVESAPKSGVTTARLLGRGQRIKVSLLGIPAPMEINFEIDGQGSVNLVWVGPVKLEGLTTSEAEALIQRTYIERDIFREVTAIVVAEEDKYFVDGEVKRPGQYPLTGNLTLLKSISAAGGYTDWANPKKIKILRGEKVIWHNGKRIAGGRDEDPLLSDGDIVYVERRGLLSF